MLTAKSQQKDRDSFIKPDRLPVMKDAITDGITKKKAKAHE